MGTSKAGAATSSRRTGRRSATRILLFSAATAAGVVAVRRSRAGRSAASPASFDDLPHLPPIPVSARSVATSVRGHGATESAPIGTPVEPPSVDGAPDQDESPEPQDTYEEPPIWAGLAEPAPTSAAPAPAFEAALTGAPVSPFAPLPAPIQEGPVDAPIGVNFPPPGDAHTPEAPLPALSGEPWAAPVIGGPSRPRHAHVPAAAPQEPGKQSLSEWSSTPKGRRILGVIGLVCLAGLMVATIIVTTH